MTQATSDKNDPRITPTPRPWRLYRDHPTADTHAFIRPEGTAFSDLETGVEIATLYSMHPNSEQEANAAFIVRACNAHDDLVLALSRIAHFPETLPPECAGIRSIARAALAALES